MKYLIFTLISFSLYAQNETYHRCSPTTPTINLELETPFPGATIRGPLFGVPQDNQDGIGTCYANVSRNVLLGLSGGRDSASYLDLALGFKRAEGRFTTEGLDNGNICPTLAEVRNHGFCAQTRAPLETGARTEIERLMGLDAHPFTAQARINTALRDFFVRRETIQSSPVGPALLPRLSQAIQRMRSDSLITFPFPGTDVEFMNGGAFKNLQDPPGLAKGESALSIYQAALTAVKPRIFQAIVQNKTPAEIHDIFMQAMTPTLTRLQLLTAATENRADFISHMAEQRNAPQFREKITATLNFLRFVSGRSDDNDEQFLSYCGSGFYPGVDFLNTVGPVVSSMSALGLNTNALFDPQGNLIPMADVFQMAVAPSCLNPENRTRSSVNFTCDENQFNVIKRQRSPLAVRMQAVRTMITDNLLQGIPVGRAYPQPGGGGHVNTIVGFRYDPASRACQVLIRDSASGSSNWHSEREVFTESDGMSFARRAP